MRRTREQHEQAVEPERDAARRAHPTERRQKALVDGGCLPMLSLSNRQITLEAPPLLRGVRELVEGVGKLMWFPIVKPRFYGAAKLRKAKPAAA